jgi:hypothetical protein
LIIRWRYIKVRISIGNKCDFKLIKTGSVIQKLSGADVIPMNVDCAISEAVIKDRYACEYTYYFDVKKVNFDERELLAYTIADALTRRIEQEVIDSLNVTTYTPTVVIGSDASSGGAVMNLATLTKINALFAKFNVPPKDRALLVNAAKLVSFLGDNTRKQNKIVFFSSKMIQFLNFNC